MEEEQYMELGTGRIAAGVALIHQTAKIADLEAQISEFLDDRRARGLSQRTLAWYSEKLRPFEAYARASGCQGLLDVTPSLLRQYLLALQSSHNPGGTHGHYRAVRALMNWFEQEYEPQGWRNPMHRVQSPKVPSVILEPVPLTHIARMIASCPSQTVTGLRDQALFLFLFDTGARAQECLDMSLGDVSLETGLCQILHGKGDKARVVFLCGRSLDALRAYLDCRGVSDPLAPLWATKKGTHLRYAGLREIARRRARRAGVPAPSLHSFRRAFALSCLRQGMDVFTLQRLMGHSDIGILRRYLAQTNDDLRKAHKLHGPVDNDLASIMPDPVAEAVG